MNTFQTQTNSKFAFKIYGLTMLITYLILALCSCYFLTISIGTFIMIEAFILLGIGFSSIITLKNNSKFTFYFEGNILYINGVKPTQVWKIYEIPATDFIITQSKSEKACDCCTVKIKNTIFKFYGVENYTQLKSYIENNFAG